MLLRHLCRSDVRLESQQTFSSFLESSLILAESETDVVGREVRVSVRVEVGGRNGDDLGAVGREVRSVRESRRRTEGKMVDARLGNKPRSGPVARTRLDHVGHLKVIGNLQSLGVDENKVSSVRNGAV